MVNDPIADFIIRIKNASAAKRDSATAPYSKLVFEIAELLKREGFLKEVSKRGKKVKKFIDLELSYEDGIPNVRGAERVSRLSRRVYLKKSDVKPVKFGHGILVLSTPQGLYTDKEARKHGVGGEALFKIW